MNMKLPKRAGKPRLAAREAILQAGERIFASKGLDGARTDEIAREAGVNKALLYYYFESKNALFNTVVDEMVSEPNQRFLGILSGPGPEGEVLLRYAGALFDFVNAKRESFGLFHRTLMTNPKIKERIMKDYWLPGFQKATDLVRRGIRSGEFRRVDPVQAVHSVQALAVSSLRAAQFYKSTGGPDPFDPKILRRRRAAMLDFIRYGLFSHPEAHAR